VPQVGPAGEQYSPEIGVLDSLLFNRSNVFRHDVLAPLCLLVSSGSAGLFVARLGEIIIPLHAGNAFMEGLLMIYRYSFRTPRLRRFESRGLSAHRALNVR
jgi:hypothetical protein